MKDKEEEDENEIGENEIGEDEESSSSGCGSWVLDGYRDE